MFEKITTSGTNAAVLLLVWLTCAAYMGMNVKRGWIPADEGILGQSAERVLKGEMPHRDFNDPYTGGLSYLNAAVFRLFGINLLWLRYLLFAIFLVWVPAFYALGRQFFEPWIAGGITLIAVAWSVPNYPAAMPSWFLLFLASFGILALLKYMNHPKMRWLFLAGFCGGLSFLFKSVGLYYIAGGLLFFVFREQNLSRTDTQQSRPTPVYVGFLTLCLAVFVFCLVKLAMIPGDLAKFVHFVLPGLTVGVLLVLREFASSNVRSAKRFSTLFAMVIPFLVAAALPIIFYFSWYWWHGELTALIRDLFILPFRRVHYAYFEPPDSILELPSLFAAFILIVVARLTGRARSFVSLLIVLIACLLFFTSRKWNPSYLVGLYSLRGIIPAIVITMLIFRFGKNGPKADKMDERTFLLFAVTAVFSLIQFPFAAPIYFCYVAPLAILLVARLIIRLNTVPRKLVYSAGLFYLCFAIFIFRSYAMSDRFIPVDQDVPLRLPRAGNLMVSHEDAAQYEELIPFVNTLAAGTPILAGPDCPEVYFLAGLNNPTPVLVDFLSSNDYTMQMQNLLDRPGFIKVVVINNGPTLSPYYGAQLVLLVHERFSESKRIGTFEVYWRP
jgi:hypothetical protein